MFLPSATRKLLRYYERVLFHDEGYAKSERVYAFYLLLKPLLEWIRIEIRDIGLVDDEIESEIYILCAELFNKYDKNKSSIVPYIERQLPYFVSNCFNRLNKNYTCQDFLYSPNNTYELDEEFYWRTPGILFEDRYVGKCFTRGQKYIIHRILVSDEKELASKKKLAEACNMSRISMLNKLLEIKDIWRKANDI